MNRQFRAWLVSLGLHAILIIFFFMLSLGPSTVRRPRIIDLTFAGAPAAMQVPPATDRPRPVRETRKESPPPENEEVPTAQPLISESATPEVQAPIPAPAETLIAAEESTAPDCAAPTSVLPEPGGSGTEEEKKQIYLREHFVYIRNLIMQELDYPPLARRMGWCGQVVVSFVVQEDGSVEKLTVVKSSGRTLLDQNALATISRVAPFPRPPVSAEIVMPIAYQLR